ncbi:MAG: DNA/RNA non-specific endonuclease [Pseudomonadota bacterium]
MAKKSTKKTETIKLDAAMKEAMRRYVRTNAHKWLGDPNVTSVGVGRKNGKPDGEICLIFTVGEKVRSSQLESLEALETKLLPGEIEIAPGISVKTDVEQRTYEQSYSLVAAQSLNGRKSRADPIQPGISVGQFERSAGTLGAIVFDEETGEPCILSNWHVLHTDEGSIGDATVQPGHFDDNNTAGNEVGSLVRSHLGAAGDCAISRIRNRSFDRTILDLGVKPSRMADAELDDPVVKSGRTTGVTYGVVRRTDVMVKIFFGENAGLVEVGGLEIGLTPETDLHPSDGEISRPGDSGSLWMIREGTDATDIVAGLHFAGESGGSTDEHAIACYPLSVQKKLRFTFEPLQGPDAPDTPADTTTDAAVESEVPRSGYDDSFLGVLAPMPEMTLSIKRDAVNFGRAQVIPYTHFSVCLSARRRLARFVAWNIDGARKVVVGGGSFRVDKRIDESLQTDNSLYSDNKLDRGHIARRADLTWGSIPEAKQANDDSYFYTNIAPQHERYNRSNKAGIWGRLENTILEQAEAQDIRCSVIGGPVFGDDDPIYRGVAIAREYWKLIAYRSAAGELSASCFVLSQNDLLSDIETLDFDPFRMFQVSVADLTERTGLGFEAYAVADVLARPADAACRASERVAEALGASSSGPISVEILNEGDLLF